MKQSLIRNKHTPFVVGLFMGVVAGGIAVGFKTPRSGPQIRQIVRDQAQSLRDQADNVILQAKSLVSAPTDHR